MTQQTKHKNESVESIEFDNDYYNDYCLNESCFYCQKEFIHIDDVLVDTERDRYICEDCANKRNIETVNCMDI